MSRHSKIAGAILLSFILAGAARGAFLRDASLPAFGRDTVLVYKTQVQKDQIFTLVVRIAQFLPDRFLEWEDSTTQGTIFMTSGALYNSRSFLTARLFDAGVDSQGRNSTTLWLSQKLFRELKASKTVKATLDSISGVLTLTGNEQVAIEVNRETILLPTIKVMDNRGNERWFLDMVQNPLMVRHTIRAFDQTLTSITTDRANTLRWIKGKKLSAPH
jgi:hypothetical protein